MIFYSKNIFITNRTKNKDTIYKVFFILSLLVHG